MDDQTQPGELTRQGPAALYEVLYQDLKRRAQRERRKLSAGQTFSTTALVNEAFFKLSRADGFASRGHFLNTAAAAMRQVLVDQARAALADKRGSGVKPLSLDDSGVGLMPADPREGGEALMELNDALEQLAELNPRLVQVVECRYFSGYTDAETAEALGVNERTVRRDWLKAKAWLYDALGGTPV